MDKKEYDKIYYQKNKEKKISAAKFYNSKRKSEISEYQKKYRIENKEKLKNLNKKYYKKEDALIKKKNQIKDLKDFYVRRRLIADGFSRELITSELIEVKRIILKTKRL